MTRSGNKYRFAGLVAVAAIVVSACGGGTATPAPATEAPASGTPATEAPATAAAGGTINIGFEGPYTGDAAASGQELKNAITMTMDEAGWKVGDYTINPVWIDDGTDPAKGAAAMEQAIVSQKIIAQLGGWNSSVAVAEMDVAAKYKLPSFFSCGAANTVTDKWRSDPAKFGYWVGKCWPDPSVLVVPYVEWLNQSAADGTIKEKTFAVWGEDTDWGRSFATSAAEQLVAAGWTKTSEDIFPLTTTDFTAMVAKWNADKAAVLIGTTTSGTVNAGMLKALQDSGNKAVMISDGVAQDPNFYANIGSASDYVVDSAPFWRQGSDKFLADYKAKFGNDPSSQAAGLAYDYAHYFLKILEATIADQGSLTSETIYKEAQEKVQTGQLAYTEGVVMDSYDFNAESLPNPVGGAGHFVFPVVQWVGGKSTLVYPNGAAGAYQPKP